MVKPILLSSKYDVYQYCDFIVVVVIIVITFYGPSLMPDLGWAQALLTQDPI